MKIVKIGLIGIGTVGQGVLEIFSKHKKAIISRAGVPMEVVAVCDLDKNKIPISLKKMYVSDWRSIVKNPDIDIVVELIGGYEPARSIILDSFKHGKSVVTANKLVLAKCWGEIFEAARRYKRLIYFEAAVGGGIPVIQTLNEGLAANKITKIIGILNGTTNYILTKMLNDNLSFENALRSAQKSGFAEPDPSNDINGIDTANKLAILSSIALGGWVSLDDISVSGIKNVGKDDIQFFKKEFNYLIKLIGKSEFIDGKIDISVRPTLITSTHPFRSVDNEYNAILLIGDFSNDIMLYGKGAGRGPAASAVMSDMIFLSRQVANDTVGIFPYINYDHHKRYKIVTPAQRYGYYYLRFTVEDKPGVLAKIASILAKNDVSIAAVYQNEPPERLRKKGAMIFIVTHRTSEGKVIKSLDIIDKLPIVKDKSVLYPIER